MLTPLLTIPSVALLRLVSKSVPQRHPGASGPPDSAPSHPALRIAPILARNCARNDLVRYELVRRDATELILGFPRRPGVSFGARLHSAI